MIREAVARELFGNFAYWRVFESPGRVLIQVADGSISTNQMYRLHEACPMGVSIHFKTSSWLIAKLFHWGILWNFQWKERE